MADLTMRRLARALEVTPGTLYWHFPSKQDLLGGIASQLLAAVPSPSSLIDDATSPSDSPKKENVVADFCVGIYTALTSLRDGAEITQAALASGTMERDLFSELREVCPDRADVLYHYIFGAALDLQARQAVASALVESELPQAETATVTRGLELILGAGNR